MQLVDHDTVSPLRLIAGGCGVDVESQFIRQLAALFESSKETGSIWITHKRRTVLLHR